MSQIRCPQCKKAIKLRAEFYGRKLKCGCGKIMRIPEKPANMEAEVIDAEIVMPTPTPTSIPSPINDSSLQTDTSRTYRHYACGQHTAVSGFDHIYVTHIFSHPEETYCSTCEAAFPVDDFCWANTGEKLRDYYQRYQSLYSDSEKFMIGGLLALIVTIVAVLIGGIIGLLIGISFGLPIAIVLAIVFAILSGVITFKVFSYQEAKINKRIIGTTDYHQLR